MRRRIPVPIVGPQRSDKMVRRGERRLELLDRLNAVPGVHIAQSRIALFPSILLAQLTAAGVLDQLIATLDWAVQSIRAAWA